MNRTRLQRESGGSVCLLRGSYPQLPAEPEIFHAGKVPGSCFFYSKAMEHGHGCPWGAFAQKEPPTHLRHCFKMGKEWGEKSSRPAPDAVRAGEQRGEKRGMSLIEVKRVWRKIRE